MKREMILKEVREKKIKNWKVKKKGKEKMVVIEMKIIGNGEEKSKKKGERSERKKIKVGWKKKDDID